MIAMAAVPRLLGKAEVSSVMDRLVRGESRRVETNGFTLGKEYPIIMVHGNGFLVRNDNGDERFILGDESPSPHITTPPSRLGYHWSIGYFQIKWEA